MTQQGSAASVLSTDSAFSPSQSFCLEAPKCTASVSFPQQPSPPDPGTLSSIGVCTVIHTPKSFEINVVLGKHIHFLLNLQNLPVKTFEYITQRHIFFGKH